MSNTFYSDSYLDLIRKVHSKKPWGEMGGKLHMIVVNLCNRFGYKEILDYGSGHGSLVKAFREKNIDIEVTEYDPGIESKSTLPNPSRFVVCIDVLEHIEEEYVDNVLDDIKRCVLDKGWLAIDMEEAGRMLPDGRNAHITIKPFDWWLSKLEDRFDILESVNYELKPKSLKRGSFLIERKK
jgi:hypothetical protein